MKVKAGAVSCAIGVVMAVFASGAHADTISWYHFDEGEIGTKPAGATAVFVDSVTGVADGKAYAHTENQFNTEESAMPEFCEAFPNSAVLYDPVSKTVAKNDKCLRFLDPKEDWNPASVVTLADRQAYRSASLTIEAFVRIERDYPDRWRFIIAKQGEIGADNKLRFAWFMGVNGTSGSLFMYVKTKTTGEDGSTTYVDTDTWCGNVSIRDGKWHHVAMVIDDVNKKILKYIDYVKQAEATYTGEIAYGAYGELADSQPVYVGKYWGGYGCFPGSIDEVRISSGVLTEKEFLRPNVGANDCLPETVLYMPFEGLNFFGGSWRTTAMLLNQALSHETATINSIKFSKVDDALVITNDAVNADFTRRDIASKVTTANTTSLKTVACPTEAKEVCPRITVNDQVGNLHSALTGSFTLELFAKINKPNALKGLRYIACLRGLSLPLYLTETGLLRYMPLWKEPGIAPNIYVCDDKWHHIAISYDRPTKTHSLYLDYKLVGSKTLDTELDASASNTSGNSYLFGWDSDAEGGVSGLFDGIRLTTKVLLPQDFLTTRAIAAESYSLMLDFEESIETVKPYGDIIPAGVNSAMANGVEAKLEGAVVATRVRSYDNAPERVNRKSLGLAGSTVVYPRNVLIEALKDQTIEFFLCGKSAAPNCGIIALKDEGGNAIWSFAANSTGGLALNVGGNSYDLETSLSDGRWNHFALSFAENAEGTVAMKIYRNRTLLKSEQILSMAAYAKAKLVLGGGEGVFTGNIDEIRISPKALGVEELMQPYIKGTLFIIR